jgi:hypothetical protein
MKTLHIILFLIAMFLITFSIRDEFMSVSYVAKSTLALILLGVMAVLVIRDYRKK